MKKQAKAGSFALVGLLALGAGQLAAQDRPIRQGSVEVILGGYRMHEPRFSAVYPQGGLIVGLGASAAIKSDFNLYLEAKYWQREGALTYSKEATTLRLFPISLGLRYILPRGFFNPYAGAGGDLYFYYEDNAIGTTVNHATGVHLLGGVYLRFAPTLPLMLNLRVRYSWVPATESGFKVQLGGFEYSAGVGLGF